MTNQQSLKALMAEHQLDDAHIAVLLSVSASSVQSWRVGRRNMPDNLLELLEIKLKQE